MHRSVHVTARCSARGCRRAVVEEVGGRGSGLIICTGEKSSSLFSQFCGNWILLMFILLQRVCHKFQI